MNMTEFLSNPENISIIVDYYSFFIIIIWLLGIIIWWFLRIIYVFLIKTNVAILATKIDKPSDKDIKRWLGLLRKELCKIKLIENLDIQNHLGYAERLKNFYMRYESKISDLLESDNISLFLLAHQSIITKLGFDFQDQKSISLYHKIRDTYWSEWAWEKWYHFKPNNIINWKKYVYGWELVTKKSSAIDFNKDLILRIQVSFPINSVINGIDQNNFIEINLEKDWVVGNKSYLRFRSQMTEFERYFKNVWKEIDSKMLASGKDIHIIMNVPAPFAFIIWRNIHSTWPIVHLYEEKNGIYEKIFTLKKP